MQHFLSLLKNYKWTVIISVLLLSSLIVIPFGIQYGLKQIILKQGQAYDIERVEIANIDFNPFLAKVRLEKLSLYRQNQAFAEVGLLEANISVLALFNKTLLIESLYLSQSQLPISLMSVDKKNQLSIAGMTIPLNAPTEKEVTSEESKLALNIGIESLIIESLSIDFELFENQVRKGKTALNIEALIITQEADFHRLILHSQFNQSPLDANLQLHPFEAQPKVLGTLDLTQFSLKKLSYLADHFAPEYAEYLDGSLSHNLTFTLTKTPTGLAYYQQGLIKFQDFNLQQETIKAALKQFSWKGDFHFVHDNGAQPNNQAVHLQGLANLEVLQIEASEQQIKLSQNLSSELNLDLQITPQQLVLTQAGSLTIADLSAVQPPYSAQVKQLQWQGNLNFSQSKDDIKASTETTQLPAMQFSINGDLELQGFNSQHQQTKLALVQFEKLNIGQFTIEQLQEIVLSQISLKQLSLAKPTENKQAGLVRVENIQLDQLQLNSVGSKSGGLNQLNLGTLLINGSQTQLNLDDQGQIALLSQLQQSLPKPNRDQVAPEIKDAAKTAASQTSTKGSDFNFTLKGIEVTGDNKIQLETHFDPKPLNKTIYLKSFKLGRIDSQKPTHKTAYALAIEFDEFSKVTSQGEFQLFDPTQHLQAKTSIESISLLELSPFAEKFAGYKINSGQFSAELETRINNRRLNAKNNLHLHQLEIANSDRGQAFKKSLNMPLELGVALLKDRKDNIHLKLPIKGKLDDLNVGLQDIISTALNNALLKASSSYLKLALQPFGAILMAGQFAADQLTAVKLQAIIFEPGLSALAPEMQRYLTKINKLLADRKAIQIKLCGGVKELDRNALQQLATQAAQKAADSKAKAAGKETKKIEPVIISDELLFALAQERKAVIKRHLIKLGSTSKQIILCQAVIQSGDGKPNVEVGL